MVESGSDRIYSSLPMIAKSMILMPAMWTTPLVAVLCTFGGACSSSDGTSDNLADAMAGDGGGGDSGSTDSPDAAAILETLITGELDGQSYTLRYSKVVFDDPLYRLCLSNDELLDQNCAYNDDDSRTLLLVPFLFVGGVEQLGPVPEILRRPPPASVREFSTEGTIELASFSQSGTDVSASGHVRIVFDSGVAEGDFVFP